MWPKLFAEARANGLNAIESYAFWNKHSATRDGAYDYGFNGDVDLFLSLAAEHDLFVLWRFGPYVCAEWPAGGIPARAPRPLEQRWRTRPLRRPGSRTCPA
jgi:beta-galactosidase